MVTAASVLLLLETVAVAAHQDQPSGKSGCQPEGSDQNRRELERAFAMSRTSITQMAMSNVLLKAQVLVSIKDQWVRFHYPVSIA